MDLNYLMTSEFNEGLTPEELIELLNKFRYEYRLLSSKNTALEKQLEKISIELENVNGLLYETEIKGKQTIALLEDEVHFISNRLNRKLTLKERISGKIDR
jgi:uncharacterized protein (DUF2344 family)